MAVALLVLVLSVTAASGAQLMLPTRESVGAARQRSLLQTWGTALNGDSSSAVDKDTPITRVVNLLKEMGKTLESEMKEDADLHEKMSCWCSSNNYEKDNSISSSKAKITELQSNIEGLTAEVASLKINIKDLDAGVATDKQALAEATALREKQQKEFHGDEMNSVQAIEQLKAAIVVLSKHHTAPPESTVGGGAIFKSDKDSWAFLSTKMKGFPWNENRQSTDLSRSLDDFMAKNGFEQSEVKAVVQPRQKFLQQEGKAKIDTEEWTATDTYTVKRALKAAAVFVQAHHAEEYMPSYNSQSGQILGVLQQLKEEMEASLSESQKEEISRAGLFDGLRKAKTAQIEEGEKASEEKEDRHAQNSNALAEAKEEFEQEQALLAENQKFLANLKTTCADAEKNFEDRKNSRMAEMQAVSEAITVLQQDTARDAMSATYSFVEIKAAGADAKRHHAAETLRKVAQKSHDPRLSVLATSVELDSFSKVTKAIDGMVEMLKQQQSDEVKKNDWCKAELHSNDMATEKTNSHKAALESKSSELAMNIKTLEDGLADSKNQISQLQLELQRASENRKTENIDFQKTVADQTVTVEVLKKALDKLAKYYDLLQTKAQIKDQVSSSQGQTPPVPTMEYKPSASAGGVMEMIEKLVHEAQALTAESRHSENDAQSTYEQFIKDTNSNVKGLQEEIVTKQKAKAQAKKDKIQTDSDIADAEGELDGLEKYNVDTHAECDYVLLNFDLRQEKRGEEIEALRQAKQILKGAALS